jgi:hypothetical protein
MRVRMIRPGYWTDTDLHTRLTADVREFYIGLWMEADDAGYVAWDIDRIGADLYPFRPLTWRRKHMAAWLEALSVKGHTCVLACGQHVVIPNLTRFQNPPKPSFQNQRAHDKCLRQVAPSGTTGDHMVPAQEGGSREGGVLEGVGQAREREDENGFGGRVQPFGEIIGSKPVRGDA